MWKRLSIGAFAGLVGAIPINAIAKWLTVSLLMTPSTIMEHGARTMISATNSIGILAALAYGLYLVFRAWRANSATEAIGKCLKSLSFIFFCVVVVSLVADRSSLILTGVGAALTVACYYVGRKLLAQTQIGA